MANELGKNVAKGVLAIGVVGALGYGAYYLYQQNKGMTQLKQMISGANWAQTGTTGGITQPAVAVQQKVSPAVIIGPKTDVVEDCSSPQKGDRCAAEAIKDSFKVKNVLVTEDLNSLAPYNVIFVVGGHMANPIYKYYYELGDIPAPQKEGDVVTEYRDYEGRLIVFVAGWSALDTYNAVKKVVAGGMPTAPTPPLTWARGRLKLRAFKGKKMGQSTTKPYVAKTAIKASTPKKTVTVVRK